MQDSWEADVLKTSSPSKNVWFNVCDFPSPVLPKIDTTFKDLSPQPNFSINSSASLTCKN